MLANPIELYNRAPDHLRRDLLGATFAQLVVHVEDDGLHIDTERTEVSGALRAGNAQRQLATPLSEAPTKKRIPRISARDSLPTFEKIPLSKGWSILNMVGVVYLCSNNSATPVTPTQIREILGAIGDSPREFQPRVKRGWNRLSDEARDDVAVRYEAGDTTTQLAKD